MAIQDNGWGFIPHGNSKTKARTARSHYFFKSNKSLCGLVNISYDVHAYRFTTHDKLMSHLLCTKCIYKIKQIKRITRLKNKKD